MAKNNMSTYFKFKKIMIEPPKIYSGAYLEKKVLDGNQLSNNSSVLMQSNNSTKLDESE